jgi:hypothetical protein
MYRDDLQELAAQLREAAQQQAAGQRLHWSALSLQAATTLEAIVGPEKLASGLRNPSRWARFRRWLWWVLNPADPR